MRIALRDVTTKAEELVKLSPGDIVVDIGCNDGTLLRSYQMHEVQLVGFEPAVNLIKHAEVGTTKIINDFFNFQAFQRSIGTKRAKIVTSIAMFYDLDDPNSFVVDVVKCLDQSGVWIIQMSYLPSMLSQNAFDNICHEHLEYYSLLSLRGLIERHKLEIFDVELNDVNGGSFRIYIKHKNSNLINIFKGAESRVKELEASEHKSALHHREIYRNFALRVINLKERLYNLIMQENENGRVIYAYGASTKGNTLLQYCNLDSKLIKAAADRSPDKWGKKTVGTLIPIISEEQARREKPDYFLILPWHFLEGFKQREKEFLKSGGRFIVPLPDFKIIGYEG
jgi:trans-aconitate methyltransferase